jgi:Alg9-like mannosyltransferase family
LLAGSGGNQFLWLWAAAAVLFFFALPHQEPRYLMPAAPPLFLLAGSGLCVVLIPPPTKSRIIGTVLVAAALIWSFLPSTRRFESPFIDDSITEEMQVAKFLDDNFPKETVVYSNFNYPMFGYYSKLRVQELPETGELLYDALNRLPKDGILIAYKDPEIIPDPRPEWLASNPHFQVFREFGSLILYKYRLNAQQPQPSR